MPTADSRTSNRATGENLQGEDGFLAPGKVTATQLKHVSQVDRRAWWPALCPNGRFVALEGT